MIRSMLRFCGGECVSKHYGHFCRILHWCVDQAMTSALARMELTAAQGHILGYLGHRESPPCPKDIEVEFRLSHPTVSGLLSRLEKKGFLELRPDPEDRRCKRIYILSKGRECLQTMHQTIQDTETRMVQNFTPQEQEQFQQYLERAIANMGGACGKCKPKEDPKE